MIPKVPLYLKALKTSLIKLDHQLCFHINFTITYHLEMLWCGGRFPDHCKGNFSKLPKSFVKCGILTLCEQLWSHCSEVPSFKNLAKRRWNHPNYRKKHGFKISVSTYKTKTTCMTGHQLQKVTVIFCNLVN